MSKDWKFFIVTSLVVSIVVFVSQVNVNLLGVFWPDNIIFSIVDSLGMGFVGTGLVVAFSALLTAWTSGYGSQNIGEQMARVRNIDMRTICCTLIVVSLLILVFWVLA